VLHTKYVVDNVFTCVLAWWHHLAGKPFRVALRGRVKAKLEGVVPVAHVMLAWESQGQGKYMNGWR